MKRFFAMMVAGISCMAMLAGCGNSTQTTETVTENAQTESSVEATETAENSEVAAAETVKIDKLTIGFVPSRDPDEIVTATEPLKDLLTQELAGLGYEVGEVDITVGTSYEAVGEGLSAGTIDVGLIPGGTYVLYEDGCDVILTATRDGARMLRIGTTTSQQSLQRIRLHSIVDLSLQDLQKQVRQLPRRLTTAKRSHGKTLMDLTGVL